MIDNLNKFDNSREEVINFFRDYIEMLTPKQMLQRLPIVLAQVKASNISESL